MEMKYILTDEETLNIASYMIDEYREYLHNKIAPCTNEEFIYEYCKIFLILRIYCLQNLE